MGGGEESGVEIAIPPAMDFGLLLGFLLFNGQAIYDIFANEGILHFITNNSPIDSIIVATCDNFTNWGVIMAWIKEGSPEIMSILCTVKEKLLEGQDDAEVVFWCDDLDVDLVRLFYHMRRSIVGNTKKKKIILVINSPGGSVDAAYSLIEILRNSCECIEVVVPVWAKSAATLVSLSANKIYMSEIAELGPLDPQVREPGEVRYKSVLDEYQAMSQIRREAFENFDYAVALIMNKSGGMSIPEVLSPASKFVATLIRPLYEQTDPKLLGKRVRQLKISEEYAIRVLRRNKAYKGQDIEELVNTLVYEYPSHSFVINYNEANELGMPVEILSDDPTIENLVKVFTVWGREISLIGSFVPDESSAETDSCSCCRNSCSKQVPMTCASLVDTQPSDEVESEPGTEIAATSEGGEGEENNDTIKDDV